MVKRWKWIQGPDDNFYSLGMKLTVQEKFKDKNDYFGSSGTKTELGGLEQ